MLLDSEILVDKAFRFAPKCSTAGQRMKSAKAGFALGMGCRFCDLWELQRCSADLFVHWLGLSDYVSSYAG